VAQVLIRDLDDEVVETIRESARRGGRSLEAELRLILEAAARRRSTDFWHVAERLREETRGRGHPDSADRIRADRNR